mgnify:CR=1 FL=1
MPERRSIGQILTGLGRIDQDDVNRALEFQRDNGGYFGEALLACGIVRKEELEFGLASQFDLPYVFPEAEAVDPEAAALVTQEWALGHMTLPIMLTDDTLTVVVDSPTNTEGVDELAERTSRTIDLALASPEVIRDVVRQVYARGTAMEEEAGSPPFGPVHLSEALAGALEAGAPRFGISTRGLTTWAWWEDTGTIRRRRLEGLWEAELRELLDPPPEGRVEGKTRASWSADLVRKGDAVAVSVDYLADESGHEFLFRPTAPRSAIQELYTPPPAGIVQEIRMLARTGSARFVVTADPEQLGHDILPHLPELLLSRSWRSIYINASEQDAADRAFSMKIPNDPARWAEELETLQAFRFDVVTVDLTGTVGDWAESALDVASVAFLRWGSEEDRLPAYAAGVRWELNVARSENGALEWSLGRIRAE